MALNNVFTDYAILQAEQKVNIWGSYHQKPQVKIIHEKSGSEFLPLSHHAENGLFTAQFSPFLPSYEEYSLQYFENGDLLQQVNHLLFGDVYLAIGQSNMAMCVAASGQSEEIQSLKKDGNHRCLLFQDRFDEKGNILLSDKPLTELLNPGWMVLDNDKVVSAVSALAYTALRQLQFEKDRPIGFIAAAMGGSAIDNWLSEECVYADEFLQKTIKKRYKWISDPKEYRNYTDQKTRPTLYKERICPILGLGIKAVLWYQGENSANDFSLAKFHERALKALINSYRKEFSQKDLPFFLIHIAIHLYLGSNFAVNYINEAMDRAAKKLKNVLTVPIYDIFPDWLKEDGELYYHPIHPTNKVQIAKRLCRAIKSRLYNKADFKFPSVKSYEIKENSIEITVSADKPLQKQEELLGFALSDGEGSYFEAKAELLSENKIRLSCPSVNNPKHFSYAFFLYNYCCNVMTEDGLPLLPFRSHYEDADKHGHYYALQFFTKPKIQQLWQNHYFPEFGGANFSPVWTAGTLTPETRVTFSYEEKDNLLRADYKTANSSSYYVGLSPKIVFSGNINIFTHYKKLFFDIKCEEGKEVDFEGLLVQAEGARRYLFLSNIKKLSKEFQTAAISFDTVKNQEYCMVKANKNLLNSIQETQLTFRTKQDGSLYLKNFRFE